MKYCEYCKTENEGDKHHPGTCANCGAAFKKDNNRFEVFPTMYTHPVNIYMRIVEWDK